MSRESQHTHFEDKIQEQVRLWDSPQLVPACIMVLMIMMIDDNDYDNDDHDDSNAVAADDDEEGTAAL